VQVHDVRHDRRADDPGGQQDALRAAEAGHDEVGRDVPRVGARVDDLPGERDEDDSGERRDARLEPPESHLLETEDREGSGPRDQSRHEQGDVEQQVEPQSRPHHLGDVGGHRDDLRLDPQADRRRARKRLPAELREVPPGSDPQLRRLGLDQHRDQVRRDDHPEEQIADCAPPETLVAKFPGSM